MNKTDKMDHGHGSQAAMLFSFEYIIDPKVCKTEEDPQEQLQLKVPSGQSPNRMS